MWQVKENLQIFCFLLSARPRWIYSLFRRKKGRYWIILSKDMENNQAFIKENWHWRLFYKKYQANNRLKMRRPHSKLRAQSSEISEGNCLAGVKGWETTETGKIRRWNLSQLTWELRGTRKRGHFKMTGSGIMGRRMFGAMKINSVFTIFFRIEWMFRQNSRVGWLEWLKSPWNSIYLN